MIFLINAILKGLFKLIISLVSLLLTPIDTLINSAFPSIASGIGYIGSFFDYIASIIGYVLSWFHLPTPLITLLVGYLTFKLTIPLAIHTVKLAIKWYHMIAP